MFKGEPRLNNRQSMTACTPLIKGAKDALYII